MARIPSNKTKSISAGEVRPIKGPTEDQIRRRAYEIYAARPNSMGNSLSDWLAAEKELMEAMNSSAAAPEAKPKSLKGSKVETRTSPKLSEPSERLERRESLAIN